MPRSVHMAVMLSNSLVVPPGTRSHSAMVHDVAGGVHDAQAAPAWTCRGRDRRPLSAPPVIAVPQVPEWHQVEGPQWAAYWHAPRLCPGPWAQGIRLLERLRVLQRVGLLERLHWSAASADRLAHRAGLAVEQALAAASQ